MTLIEKISELLAKHIRKELTCEEAVYLEEWLNQSKRNQQLFELVSTIPDVTAEGPPIDEIKPAEIDNAWGKLKEMGWKRRKVARVNVNWELNVVAAAFMIGVVCTCIFWVRDSNNNQMPRGGNKLSQELRPQTPKSYLTLGNGETIALDDLHDGSLAIQGSAIVTKSKVGGLRYSKLNKNRRQLIYNKVTVPWRNEVVSIKLSDGSKVWLNAESSIRFPVVFWGNERRVEITGEVYFEVDNPKPWAGQSSSFVVNSGGIRIAAQKARFKVSMNRTIGVVQITLLEGSVKLELNGLEQNIKTGQKAVLYDKTIDVTDNVDIDAEMAWKKG